jgi:hypothetical protein
MDRAARRAAGPGPVVVPFTSRLKVSASGRIDMDEHVPNAAATRPASLAP